MLSRISLFVCTLVMLYASFGFYPRWEKPKGEATLSWDVSGYYWYLPSVFIYKDLKKQHFAKEILEKYQPAGTDFQQAFQHESGNYVLKYSSGMAVMYLPFFAVAHILAEPLGFPPDGFSKPYQFAIQFGGLLVAIVGIWLLGRFLRHYFRDKVVAIALFLLVVGTNFLNYGAIDTGMTHGWLFTVYVLILINTRAFYHHPEKRIQSAIYLGLLCGLATLVRPTDIITALIPLLWGLKSLSVQAIRSHFDFLKRHLRFLMVSFILGALVFSIQLIYWKYASGEWIVYSYQDQGFSWTSPSFIDYMFGGRNGWLLYAPLMILSLLGLFIYTRREDHGIAVAAFILVDLYIVASWEFYWYGGRFMVQAYPLLLLPFCSFMEWILERKVRWLLATPVVVLFAYIGAWTVINYHWGSIYDWETGNSNYYFATVGRWKVDEEVYKLRDTDEIYQGELAEAAILYEHNFESDTTCSEEPISGDRSACVSPENREVVLKIPVSEFGRDWLRVEAVFRCKQKEWNVWRMSQFLVSFYKGGEEIKVKMIRPHRFLWDGRTRSIHIDTKVPDEPYDEIRVILAHPFSDQVLLIDDLKLIAFNEA